MSKPKEYRNVYIAGSGSTIYGGLDILTEVNEGTYFPKASGFGTDDFGDYVDEGKADTTINDDGSISYSYERTYPDFTVDMDCKMETIESGTASGECKYDVINSMTCTYTTQNISQRFHP